jgi:hypothetical protein
MKSRETCWLMLDSVSEIRNKGKKNFWAFRFPTLLSSIRHRWEVVQEVRTITVYAMPVATIRKGFGGFFGRWAYVECPTRPKKTIMTIGVENNWTPFKEIMDFSIGVPGQKSWAIVWENHPKIVGKNIRIQLGSPYCRSHDVCLFFLGGKN